MKVELMLCDFTDRAGIPVINSAHPTFCWGASGNGNQDIQSAFQVKLWQASPKNLVWDSGKIVSFSNMLRYPSEDLRPQTTYMWQVQLWDRDDIPAPASALKTFLTGSLRENDYLRTSQRMVKFEYRSPVLFEKRGTGSYFIDFGKDAFGSLMLTLPVTRQKTISVCLGEVLDSDGALYIPSPGSVECNRRFRETKAALMPGKSEHHVQIPIPQEKDGYQQLTYNCTAPGAVRCPEHTGELMPFRYCQINGLEEDLLPSHVTHLAASYPFCEASSSFFSNSHALNRVYDFCRYTIKASSAFGVYIDGDRERLPYGQDVFITQLCHYCIDSEYLLTRHSLKYLLNNGLDWPYESIMSIILSFREDAFHTGNSEFCERHYETLKNFLFPGLTRGDGLMVTDKRSSQDPAFAQINARYKTFRHLIEWPSSVSADFDDSDVNIVSNCFYYRALKAIADIAGYLDLPVEQQTFLDRSRVLRQTIRNIFLNKERKLFVDSENSSHYSVHGNMHAVVSGIADREEYASIIEFLKGKGMGCGVSGSLFLLEALCMGGAADHALKLLTASDRRSWLGMLAQGATMTMECWNNDLKPNQDWNHPWGCVPVYIIVRYLMGIRPLDRGCSRLLIAPEINILKRASCRCPSVRGDIEVSFKRDKHFFELSCVIPASCEAELRLPSDNLHNITLYSRQTERRLVSDKQGYVMKHLPPGRHFIKALCRDTQIRNSAINIDFSQSLKIKTCQGRKVSNESVK